MSTGYRIQTVGEAWTIVHAAATDHANRAMRSAGRRRWNDEDDQSYRDRLYKLLTSFGFSDAERDQLTSLYLTMRADQGAPFIKGSPEIAA